MLIFLCFRFVVSPELPDQSFSFEKGDAALVGRLHSPDVIKYFGGNNVTIGREAVKRGERLDSK